MSTTGRGPIEEPCKAAPSVMLVAMPWEILELPPLQLATLCSVLERVGIPTAVRSFKLDFMEHCLSGSTAGPDGPRITLDDYHRIGREYYDGSLSDWVFAVPPFRDSRLLDEDYFSQLRGRGVADADIATARAMKALVPGFLDNCVDDIVAAAPAVVGFLAPQTQFGPMAYSQAVPLLALSSLLSSRRPEIRIVMGGVHCSGPMGAALHRSFPWLDVVIRTEAEAILPEIVRAMMAGSQVSPQPGLCYRENGNTVVVAEGAGGLVSMDQVPIPVHDEYFERLERMSFCNEIRSAVRLTYESSRGCWWGAKSPCTFCGLNGIGMTFRSKPPERVVEELTALAAKYGRLGFSVADNILDQRYLREVLPLLRELGYDFRLFYEIKANLKKAEILLLREAGVGRIQPGIESLSTPILQLMRKGVTALQNVRLLKWCAEYGLEVSWNLLFGLPGEPPGEYDRMAELIPSLTHLQPPRMVPLGLERFSPYHDRPADFGLEIVGPPPQARVVYPVDDASLGELVHAFEYRRVDGSDPENYVGATRRVVDDWRIGYEEGYRSLRYHRGPGFVRIVDRRPNLPARDYSLGGPEAEIYVACDDGATPEEVWQQICGSGTAGSTVAEIREFLDELVSLRLAYQENDRYLTLALSTALVEHESNPSASRAA